MNTVENYNIKLKIFFSVLKKCIKNFFKKEIFSFYLCNAGIRHTEKTENCSIYRSNHRVPETIKN